MGILDKLIEKEDLKRYIRAKQNLLEIHKKNPNWRAKQKELQALYRIICEGQLKQKTKKLEKAIMEHNRKKCPVCGNGVRVEEKQEQIPSTNLCMRYKRIPFLVCRSDKCNWERCIG